MDFIRVEKNRKKGIGRCGSLGLGVRARDEIRWQCMLVASRLKSAWLVDKLAVTDADELCSWCREIMSEDGSIIPAILLRSNIHNDASVQQQQEEEQEEEQQQHPMLVILEVGSDFFIMRLDVLRSKMRDSPDMLQRFMVIDINGDTPLALNDTVKDSVLDRHETLCKAFDFLHDGLFLDKDHNYIQVIRIPEGNYATLVDSFGLPFLAGFLLEYPCVYYYTSNEGNALSMVPLVRVECQVTSSSSKEVTLINVLEFSVPQPFEDNELYKTVYASKIAIMQSILDNDELISSQVSNLIFQRSVHTLSRVAL